MANAMNVAFRNTLDIQSPSKVGYESALWYPAGVVNAIRDSIPNVVNVTSQFANAIDETMFNARKTSINAMQSVGKINYETDISNMFINALSNLQLIIEAIISIWMATYSKSYFKNTRYANQERCNMIEKRLIRHIPLKQSIKITVEGNYVNLDDYGALLVGKNKVNSPDIKQKRL